MKCPQCSNINDFDATFCASCGLSIPATTSVYVPSGSPSTVYGQAIPTAPPAPAQSPPSVSNVEVEALDYKSYVELLCQGQGTLAQLAIRFYYITGLKSYLVTHHDCFVVPNLRHDTASTLRRIKQEMDALGYKELLTTYLYMKTEHIQTLPYLSRSMIKNQPGVTPNINVVKLLSGGLSLALEIIFGFFYVIADGIKWVLNAANQQAGLGIRSIGHDGQDEMATGKRLLLASTYRHSRTYTYVHNVGPETYVGWFTHHEPVIGGLGLLLLTLAFVMFGFFMGASINLPFLSLIGVIGGIATTFWVAPLLLNRFGALPQPRYISAIVSVMSFLVMMVTGLGLLNSLSSPERILNRGLSLSGSSDPFLIILMVAAFAANYWLWAVALLVYLRINGLTLWHFDQFDAETHAKIVQQRIGMILGEWLEKEGYMPGEIADILSQRTPGVGRYRRART